MDRPERPADDPHPAPDPASAGTQAVEGTDAEARKTGGGASSRASRGKMPARATEVNRVVVTDRALASVVGLAAHEVPGVVGMAPVTLGEGLRRVLGLSQVDEGVDVEHPKGAGRADVDVHIVVAFGVNIPVVAESVRDRVRYAAKHFAGIELDEVRVHVKGVSRG